MIRVTLIGHDSQNPNLGVGALTVSDVEVVRRIAKNLGIKVHITILIGKGTQPSCITGDDVSEKIVRPLRYPKDFFSAVRASDLVIDISGGDSFADIYGDRRIFQILLQKYLVHLSRRPLIMAPQTIGPFSKTIWRMLAVGSIRRCVAVATRDDKSTAFLREIGIKNEVIESSDVALRLPFGQSSSQKKKGKPKVGLNVSGLLMSGGYTGKNMFGLKTDYPVLIEKIIQEFQSQSESCELHLIGHVIPQERGGAEDDYQACLDLAKKFPDTILAPAFRTPSEAKSYIAGLDFFMGARMHACIAAFSSGVPVVPMAYSRKFEGLFGTLGYDLTVDCTADTAESILEAILKAYQSREDLKDKMKVAQERGLARLHLYEYALEQIIHQLAT